MVFYHPPLKNVQFWRIFHFFENFHCLLMFTSLFDQVSPVSYSPYSNPNPCTSRTWCARTTFPQKTIHLGFNHTQICFIQGVLKKCLNVRHKLGTCQTCKTCTLSFTQEGHAEPLSHYFNLSCNHS